MSWRKPSSQGIRVGRSRRVDVKVQIFMFRIGRFGRYWLDIREEEDEDRVGSVEDVRRVTSMKRKNVPIRKA